MLESIEESEVSEKLEHAESGRWIERPTSRVAAASSGRGVEGPNTSRMPGSGVLGGKRKRLGRGVRGRGDSTGGGVDWRMVCESMKGGINRPGVCGAVSR